MPKIRYINLKEAYHKKQMTGRFSQELLDAIKHSLGQGEQVILFQNRRGFSPVVELTTLVLSPQFTIGDVSLPFMDFKKQLPCHFKGNGMPILIIGWHAAREM